MCVCVRSGFNFPCLHWFSVICTEFQMPLYCFCVWAQRALVKCLLPLESTHPLINVLPVSLCREMVEPCELFSLTCYPSNLLVIVKSLLWHLFSSHHLSSIIVTRAGHNILLVTTAVSKHIECFLLSVCLLPCPRRPLAALATASGV